MLPIVDRPAIQYVVEEAVAAGIDDILIVTGRGKRAIEDHFDRVPSSRTSSSREGKTAELDEVRRLDRAGPTSTSSARASRWAWATPCRWPATTSATSPFAVLLRRRPHGSTPRRCSSA